MRYLIAALLFFTNTASAGLNDVDKAYLPSLNIMSNPGFELGKLGWSASGGTFSLVTSGSNLLIGGVSSTWDSGSAAQTLTSSAITIPHGLKSKNGIGYCTIQTPSGTASHKIQVYDGTNVVAETNVFSSASPVKSGINFIMPSSGTVAIRILSVASDEPLIAIDDCYLGEANNIGQSSSAILVGESYFAGTTNCTGWTRTSTTVGALSTDADCPGPTIVYQNLGTWQTTDADLPRQTINNLPSGVYRAHFWAPTLIGTSASMALAINDGTTTCEASQGSNDTAATTGQSVSCVFSYTNQANRSFELYVASSAGAVTVSNGVTTPRISTKFWLEKYPSGADQTYFPSLVSASWSGYHDSDCSWSTTSTSYTDPAADGTCTFTEVYNQNFGTVASTGAKTPGINFTPGRIGRYFVCADFLGSVASGESRYQLLDGATVISQTSNAETAATKSGMSLCGVVVASSIASKDVKIQVAVTAGTNTLTGQTASPTVRSINWSIFQIDQQFPTPVIVNSVQNSRTTATNICSAYITNAGTPTISRADGSCISSATDNGTGDTTLNFAAGTFSGAPNCAVTSETAAGAKCYISSSTAASSSVVRTQCVNSGEAAADANHTVICIGPK